MATQIEETMFQEEDLSTEEMDEELEIQVEEAKDEEEEIAEEESDVDETVEEIAEIVEEELELDGDEADEEEVAETIDLVVEEVEPILGLQGEEQVESEEAQVANAIERHHQKMLDKLAKHGHKLNGDWGNFNASSWREHVKQDRHGHGAKHAMSPEQQQEYFDFNVTSWRSGHQHNFPKHHKAPKNLQDETGNRFLLGPVKSLLEQKGGHSVAAFGALGFVACVTLWLIKRRGGARNNVLASVVEEELV